MGINGKNFDDAPCHTAALQVLGGSEQGVKWFPAARVGISMN